MDKVKNLDELIVPLKDEDTLIIGGFEGGRRSDRVFARLGTKLQARNLLVVDSTSAGDTSEQLRKLIRERARGLIAPLISRSNFPAEIACEESPQDVLLERIRAGGAGIPAFCIAAEKAAADRPRKTIAGKECVVETAIAGEVGIIKVKKADTDGNCYIPAGQRKLEYIAYATEYTLVVADEILPVGEIDHEYISVPGILVTAVTQV